MPDSPSLNHIGQIAVYVKDLDRAVKFYRDTLGMPFLFQAPPGLAFFDCSGVRLMLDQPESGSAEEKMGTSILYYHVPDIDAAYAHFTGKGVQFIQPPEKIAELPDHQLWMAFFKDSESNTLALMSEKRP